MRVTSICLGALATNCYLVEFDGTTVLIDPAEDSNRLRSFVGNRKIDLVVNTHGHSDHTGGDWAFDGAKVLVHRADRSLLASAQPNHPPIDRYIDEGDEIAEGLTVLHTPGHSPGSVVLLGDGVLFSGDLLFAGSIGRTDLPGGSAEGIVESLRRIVGLVGDRVVYPGHGAGTTLESERRTNPFLQGLR
jgi:hydroxyacylglutathione hydrolase